MLKRLRLGAAWRNIASLVQWRLRKRRVGKHLLFYDLFSAVQQPGCPLCRLVADAGARRLAYLFHEEVNDPPTRLRLRASLGFCPRHARQSAHPGNALGLAIIYKDLAERALERLQSRDRSLLQQGCPECEEEQRDEERFTQALAISLLEPELQSAYLKGDGLCMPHLQLVGRWAPPESWRFLQRAEQERLHRLAEELGEFIRKNDYRFKDEPMGSERNVWLRALCKLSGLQHKEGDAL
ncbi:hypothetical protein CWRG_02281 [Chthonomonas calidirosea]|uniref:DUF6062 family protein n=1 Tax=Chthonomonas calidirosea TaxID=454171 RepID=UPI0006DD42F3|nr:DUF6062 family protein [Chthonomonas calidirosea]CEK18769.1 hypothetical protein CWRG_02281 [Chthonomonas calidirosea]